MSFRYTWGMHQYLRRLFRQRRRAVHTVDVTIRVDDRATGELRKLSDAARACWPPAYDDRPPSDDDMPGWNGLTPQ